jgi:hypothetical protein
MKKEQEYSKYLKECLTFAQRTADAILGQNNEMKKELLLSIFDKVCSPHFFFMQNTEPEEPLPQPPTEKQIAYAKQLGIHEPEKYSRQQLSDEIDKTRQKNKESQGVK